MQLFWILLCLAAGLLPVSAAPGNETVLVTVDPKRTEGISRLTLGVTHTRYSLDTGGDTEAIGRAKALLSAASRYQNVHIMGWGTMNPNPAPGVYDWESLDRRMEMVRSMKTVPVITLCAAPDWMKGGEAGKTDWSKIETAPLPEHYADFAALAKKVAQRYPDVRYFQVWNEFKGFWNPAQNNWDGEKYTQMYNLVYDALKSVNAAIKVGGPYLVVEGTGSGKGDSWATEKPIRARQWEVLDYWLKHKRGADFLVLDRSVRSFHDKNSYTIDELMALTRTFGDVARQMRKKTSLPLWWAEYYGGLPKDTKPEVIAALHASLLAHMARSGASAALLWQPMDTGEVDHALFTDVRQPGGGRPLPYYRIFKTFHDHFAAGTRLRRTISSSPDIEALSSDKNLLLINKRAAAVVVQTGSARTTLAPYEVRLLSIARATR